jgi:hypothetical protein
MKLSATLARWLIPRTRPVALRTNNPESVTAVVSMREASSAMRILLD